MIDSSRPNSQAQVIVLSIIHDGLTPTLAARRFGVSRTWIYRLLDRYKTGGLEALEPRSRRPKSNSRAISDLVKEEIIRLRFELLAKGLDAGAASIAWQLSKQSVYVPALSTIWRTLKAAGLITPEPKKRPKTTIIRFEAVQPNETWQSDFTHWHLDDGRDVEIINWLDDHSRMLLLCSAYLRITGKVVVDTFNQCQKLYGTPFSTLTDNGNVYTSRLVGGRNGFEYLLAELDVVQKNGSPAHPQTQGKIERFHQTLKKWLNQKPIAKDLIQLQTQLDEFREIYNSKRPHKGLEMKTPQSCYEATIKATPKVAKDKEHYRVRHDHVDKFGKLSLRRAGKMHHLGVGGENRFKKVLVIVDHYKVSVVEQKTGEILSQHSIEPSRDYWTNFLIDDQTKRCRKPKELNG